MRLQRLELFGFKSFADRTVLSFEPSFTGIVGPNGCGKSNVVDSVRWVLGETRPTSMRGGEMSDVIFKGSVSRPPMNVAEVTMVLDNSSGNISGQGAEVAITRRVFRTGEGEYLINGERVRLKDVRDMLFDTGLGSRGYAVLEQGKIDAVLSANPLDRRAIFEEAAGVSRYKMRRKETEQKLKRVEADLLRVDDVLKELATRVRSLKIQAGKAERFVAARDEWRDGRSRFLKHKLHEQRHALAAVLMAIEELETRSESLRRLRADEEGDASVREREQAALAGEVDRLASEVTRLAGEVRACDERHAQLLSRAQSLKAAGAEEAARALELASSLEMREAELETTREAARAAETAAATAKQGAAALAQALQEERVRHRELRASCEQQNTVVLGHLHERTSSQNTLKHLESSRPALLERTTRMQGRLDESRQQVDGMRAELAQAEERGASSSQEFAAAEARVRETAEAWNALERDEAARRGEKSKREIERARLVARIDGLRDLEHERASLEAGARSLLDSVKKGQGPCTAGDLRGVVADHLRASTQHARALDAALGPAALGLVAQNADLAARMVAWLGEKRSGIVRAFTPRSLTSKPRAAELGAGVEGCSRLVEEIEISADFEPLAQWLIGDVLLVENLERAVALVDEHPQWRFVTPAGDMVSAAGVQGGHREMTQGAVGRRAFAAELTRELEALDKLLAVDVTELERLGAERKRLAQVRSEVQATLDRARVAAAEARAAAQTAKARLADLERSLAILERERETLAREEARMEGDLRGASSRLGEASEAFERENALLADLERQRHALEARVEELQRQESRAQIDATRVGSEQAAFTQRLRDLERHCEQSRSELERARRLAGEHHKNAESASSEAKAVRERADGLLVERAQAEQRHEDLRSAERAGREAVQTFRQRVDAVTREIEVLAGQLSGQRLQAQRIEMTCAELVVRTQEDLGLSEEQLLADFEPEAELALLGALDSLEQAVLESKRRLDAIGPVNTEAVAELAEASHRFEFLSTQRKDLDDSRRTLGEALAHLNQESMRLFTDTFAEVRGHFQTLFRQLFGGGKADLELQQGVDPLEAGIDIVARPPGREMLPIGLLSGGQRTMTALALLFAVFRARPSPFCVLDEVDAALDDANVGRFLAMVDGFRASTQFIVVTHNKGTMAACTRLYGITMETKGVSSWVAVQFDDVDAFVPDAAGNAKAAAQARVEAESEPADADGGANEERGVERIVELIPQPPPGAAAGEATEEAAVDETTASGEPPVEFSSGEPQAEEVGSRREGA